MSAFRERHITVRQRRARLRKTAQSLFAVRRLLVAAHRCRSIVGGVEAFDLLLERHPEYTRRVRFVAFLVPSRLR